MATATSMILVPGETSPNTVTSGIRAMLSPAGLLTAPAIGIGSDLGAGPGLTILRGALLPSTMAVGTILQAAGAGAPVRFMVPRFTDPLLWASSAAVSDLASAGFRWALANRSFPGSTTVADSSSGSIPAIPSSGTGMYSIPTLATSTL